MTDNKQQTIIKSSVIQTVIILFHHPTNDFEESIREKKCKSRNTFSRSFTLLLIQKCVLNLSTLRSARYQYLALVLRVINVEERVFFILDLQINYWLLVLWKSMPFILHLPPPALTDMPTMEQNCPLLSRINLFYRGNNTPVYCKSDYIHEVLFFANFREFDISLTHKTRRNVYVIFFTETSEMEI